MKSHIRRRAPKPTKGMSALMNRAVPGPIFDGDVAGDGAF
jgi:hypothetical protein